MAHYDSSILAAHPASQIVPLSDELAAKFADSDFSDALITRVLAVRPDRAMIEAWLDAGFPTPEHVERWVTNAERSLHSTLVLRMATWADEDMLVDLCANSPETVGDWTVTVERGPNPYAQYRLQEHPNVNVLEDQRVALGMAASSTRNTYIQGERTSVHFMSGWRIRDGFRGLGLSNLLRDGGGPGTGWFGLVTYYYVRRDNSSAVWIEHINDDMKDRPEGFAVDTEKLSASVTVFAADSTMASLDAGSGTVIRKATPADLATCVELINDTHKGLDLFRPYTIEFLEERLEDPNWGPKPPFMPEVYGWEDFRIIEVEGRPVACGGLWDRGRDVREIWQQGDSRIVHDPMALLDFGFATGHEQAMVQLIYEFIRTSASLERTGVMAPLEFLPSLQAAAVHLDARLDSRELLVVPLTMPGLSIDLTVTRPYTDLAYW